MLTKGKGYPDISTREFVAKVVLQLRSASNSLLRTTPIYGLVDYDPHGIEILAIYKYGSISLAHESHRLAVSEIQWLGVKGQHVPADQWLPLSTRDRRKAESLLQSPWINQNPLWREELSRILFRNCKAEIQSIPNLPEYVHQRLASGIV